MNANFQAKFLQHLNSNKADNEGFTLIELLVVIIIIGILAAIALPSFLNQAAKAKQAEGKNNVGAVNRAQQSYRLENEAFAPTFTDLKIGIPTQGNNYSFTLASDGDTGLEATILAEAIDKESVRAYAGKVQLGQDEGNKGQSFSAACGEEEPAGATAVPAINAVEQDPAARCPGGWEVVE
jgi:type IV pilus assembly protein PilA